MSALLNNQVKGSDEINISKLFDLFRRRWYFIPVFLVVSLSICKLYLRYTKPVYQANATIKIEDNTSNLSNIGLAFQDFNTLSLNITNEIQIIKSKHLLTTALKRMNMEVSYYDIGTFLSSEMYKNAPFKVVYDKEKKILYNWLFDIEFISKEKFKVSWEHNDQTQSLEAYLGEKVNVLGFEFQLIKTDITPIIIGHQYGFKVNSINGLVNRARKGLIVEQSGFLLSIVQISMKDMVPRFASEFVNTLCDVYEEQDIDHKTQAANQTLTFIQEQLDTLEKRVQESETNLELFKQNKQMLDVAQQGQYDFGKLQDWESRKVEMEFEDLMLQGLKKELANNQKELSRIPASLKGDGDQLLNALIEAYNGLYLERLRSLQKNTPNSPKVKEFDFRIAELRKAVDERITFLSSNLNLKVQFFENEIEKSRADLRKIPGTERGFATLEREYNVTEGIYSNLLEKRYEASIAKASIVPSVRVIDAAAIPKAPISPLVNKIYIFGIGIGFGAGTIIILIIGLLKNTVSYKDEIESISVTPLIGVVRRSNIGLKAKFPQMIIMDSPKSALSESIRTIRTNLQFISPDVKNKVIAISSTVSGEGKSFVTINLAGIISLLDKKVVILDLDLRRPKLHYSFDKENHRGLSTYLVGKTSLDEVLLDTEFPNLHIITSGPIPPNPSELLQGARMDNLLEKLRETFDYILVDTPPIGLVTDGTTILRNADIALYVIRSDYSKKSYATIPDQLVEDHKIRNLFIVMNSVNQAGSKYGRYGSYGSYGGYGSSSGYYMDEQKKAPWWKFWKK